ncbi:hypothetical protein ACFSZQ_09430 [Sphingobacterium arenae]
MGVACHQTLSNLPLKKDCPYDDSLMNANLNRNMWNYSAVNMDATWTHGQFGVRLYYPYPHPDPASSSGLPRFVDDIISL